MKQQTKLKQTEMGKTPEDWEVTTLGKVSKINMGQSPPSNTYNDQRIGLPFFQGNKDFGEKYPIKVIYCSNPKKVAERGEILFSVRAPVGHVNIAIDKCCIGRGVSSFLMKNDNQEFLFYLLRYYKPKFKQIFESEGTVFGCASKGGLNNFEVSIPKSNLEQSAIAKILSSLDDKIELNQRINKTLETIGQALFKYWFLDFEFPNEKGKPYKSSGGEMIDSELGEIPIGWKIESIKEFGKVICGKTPSTSDKENFGDNYPFITIPDMHGNVFIVKTERKLSKIGAETQNKKELPPLSVCVSCIATTGLVSLTTEPSFTNQQINSIICNNNISPYFMYLQMKNKEEEINIGGLGGTATLNLNTGNFEKIKLINPEQRVMKNFNGLVENIFNKILENSKEIESLQQIRDSLLPQLMSGKIRVNIK